MRFVCCIVVCLVLVASSFGCSSSELRITVPDGYRGEIHLACNSISSKSAVGSVDVGGNGSLANCPAKRTRVYVSQEGQTTPVNDVQWNRTGDGILTGIRFKVQ